MDIGTGLTALQAANTCLQGILAVVKKSKELDEQLSILDFKDQLIELREKLQDVRDECNALVHENQNLQEQLKLKDEMQHEEDGNIIWRIVGEKRYGPYCSTCYMGEGKAITLSSSSDVGAWNCPKCKNHFNTKQWDVDQLEKYQALRRSHGW